MNAAASLTNRTSPGSRRSLSAAFGTPVSRSEFTLKHWYSGWVYGRPTQDLADVVTVLGDFIQPPLNIYERLWICHVVNYDDAVGVSVVPGDRWSGINWWPQRWRCSALHTVIQRNSGEKVSEIITLRWWFETSPAPPCPRSAASPAPRRYPPSGS